MERHIHPISPLRLRRLCRTALLCSAVLGPAGAFQAHASDHESRPIPFNIPAQQLGSALTAFAEQAKVQIVVEPEILRGLTTVGVSGEYDAGDALNNLLGKSGLHYRLAGAKTIAVVRVAQAERQASPKVVSAPAKPKEEAVTLEVITVTARKIKENIQNIPISVTAVNQEALTKAGIRTVLDLPMVTPGLQTSQDPIDSTNVIFNIRGQSRGIAESSIGTYVDGVYRETIFGLAGTLFDLDRIEILKGPQGTLYGKNTSAGAVSIYTHLPDLNKFGGSIGVNAGSFSTVTTQAVLNVPIVPDVLALRIAAAYDYSDGYAHDAAGHRLQNRKNPFVRGSLRYASDRLEIVLRADYGSFRGGGGIGKIQEVSPGATSLAANVTLGAGFTPGNPGLALLQQDLNDPSYYSAHGTTQPFSNVDVGGVSLNVDWDINDNTHLKSISAYRKLNRSTFLDLDGTALTLLESETGSKGIFYSQEFDLNGKLLDQRLEWLTGAFISRNLGRSSAGRIGQHILPALTGGSTGFPSSTDDTNSYGLFVHGVYHLTDSLSLTAGGRYSKEKRTNIGSGYSISATGVRTCSLAAYGATLANNCAVNLATATGPGVPTPLGPVDESSGTYEFAITDLITDDITAYATTRRGYRAGDFNGTAFNKFSPETATDYEIGLKSQWLQKRFLANIAGYITQYNNIQKAQVIAASTTRVTNASKASIKGLEIELQGKLTPSLHVGATYTYTNAKYDVFQDIFPAVKDYSGEPFPIAKNVLTLDGSYTARLGDNDSITFNANAAYQSKVYFTEFSHLLNITSDPTLFQSAYWLFNARISFNAPEYGLEFALIGRNLGNKNYWTQGTDVRSAGFVFLNPGVPRYLGIELIKHFGDE